MMKEEFKKNKEKLFKSLLSENYHNDLLLIIDSLHNQKYTKKEIYELFLLFHREIQKDNRTKENEKIYDQLSDFMDGFSSWEKGFKILPDEPNL